MQAQNWKRGAAAGLFAFALLTAAQAARAQTGIAVSTSPQTVSSLPADSHPTTPASLLQNGAAATLSAAPPAGEESASARTPAQRVTDDIRAAAARIAHLTAAQRRRWEMAQASLPGFCHKWDELLHDREVNNLAHLDWHEKQGFETASYTGYGDVQSCVAKESDEGVPIGKVTYEERNYYLAGKTTTDAKSHPKLLSVTKTLEIFSYEKDRWFY